MSSELASLIEANTRIDGTFPTPIPGLHLARYSSRTQPGHAVQSPTLAIVAQGTKQVMLGNEAFTYAPGYCLVVSLDLPVSGRVTTASKAKPFLGMHMDLDVKQIPSLRTSGKIQRAKKPDRGVFLSRMTPELLDPVLRLLRLLGKPEDSAVLAPLLQREILYRLWRGEQGEQLARMAQSDGNASGVVKAVIWLKENFDKPFSIKLIAEETNMSPSGLHHHFKTLHEVKIEVVFVAWQHSRVAEFSGTRGYPFTGRRASKPTSQKANRAHDPQSASHANFPLIDGHHANAPARNYRWVTAGEPLLRSSRAVPR